jgi:hypothetical protein
MALSSASTRCSRVPCTPQHSRQGKLPIRDAPQGAKQCDASTKPADGTGLALCGYSIAPVRNAEAAGRLAHLSNRLAGQLAPGGQVAPAAAAGSKGGFTHQYTKSGPVCRRGMPHQNWHCSGGQLKSCNLLQLLMPLPSTQVPIHPPTNFTHLTCRSASGSFSSRARTRAAGRGRGGRQGQGARGSQRLRRAERRALHCTALHSGKRCWACLAARRRPVNCGGDAPLAPAAADSSSSRQRRTQDGDLQRRRGHPLCQPRLLAGAPRHAARRAIRRLCLEAGSTRGTHTRLASKQAAGSALPEQPPYQRSNAAHASTAHTTYLRHCEPPIERHLWPPLAAGLPLAAGRGQHHPERRPLPAAARCLYAGCCRCCCSLLLWAGGWVLVAVSERRRLLLLLGRGRRR